MDDGVRSFELPPKIRAVVSPLVLSLRWAAAMFGLIFATMRALEGDLHVVVTLTVCLFLTTWRTTLPLRLSSLQPVDMAMAILDGFILGAAVGWSGGPSSPFVLCAIVAVAIAAFGWSYRIGLVSLATTLVALLATVTFSGQTDHLRNGTSLAVFGGFLAAAAIPPFARSALLNAEAKRLALAGRIEALSETNDLLTMLNRVARTLPTSLNLREALERAHLQIQQTFAPKVVSLLEFDEAHQDFAPKISDGCITRPISTLSQLPPVLRDAFSADGPVLRADLDPTLAITAESHSGLYVRLDSRGKTVGLLGMEHPTAGYFTERHVVLLRGLGELLALTLDNARWFGRLRSLGAEEERVRIARDLHDRLGQWLTYISFELERIITADDEGHPDLDRLYTDVQKALDELRDTLSQLRTGVSDAEPLAKVGQELVDRFRSRSDAEFTWTADPRGEHLPVPIEHEMLRILQEALNNINKHAQARHVAVTYAVTDGVGRLDIVDDGVGFDAATGVRDSAYGLVGMRERADTIGARLLIESSPGSGTRITVVAGAAPGKTGSGA